MGIFSIGSRMARARADAYDRVSGFNESLWRQFSEPEFPSVCVLVTHGLMSRIFLMKWYHFSVEYFEDLRNVNHCEFIVMQREEGSEKFVLQTKLRTWSELKEQRRLEGLASPGAEEDGSGKAQKPQWGGCGAGLQSFQAVRESPEEEGVCQPGEAGRRDLS